MKLYDKNAIARFLNMTSKNVDKLTQKGVIKCYADTKLYSLIDCVHDYIDYLKGDSQSEKDIDLNEERARLTKTKRLIEELDFKQRSGELHRTEDIEKIMSATLINFKRRLTAIPAEESDKLASMSDKAKIFSYLNAKIKDALKELANFEEVFKGEISEDEERND